MDFVSSVCHPRVCLLPLVLFRRDYVVDPRQTTTTTTSRNAQRRGNRQEAHPGELDHGLQQDILPVRVLLRKCPMSGSIHGVIIAVIVVIFVLAVIVVVVVSVSFIVDTAPRPSVC